MSARFTFPEVLGIAITVSRFGLHDRRQCILDEKKKDNSLGEG
jgi:hypothetical protein